MTYSYNTLKHIKKITQLYHFEMQASYNYSTQENTRKYRNILNNIVDD